MRSETNFRFIYTSTAITHLPQRQDRRYTHTGTKKSELHNYNPNVKRIEFPVLNPTPGFLSKIEARTPGSYILLGLLQFRTNMLSSFGIAYRPSLHDARQTLQ